jgi:hypothetical protein
MTSLRLTSISSVLVLLGTALVLTCSSFCFAAENSPKTYKVKGTALEIEAVRLTIQTGKNRTITVHTAEDYRERVTPGAEVTAWYHPQGEINKLDRIEYPLEIPFESPNEFVPQIKRVIMLPSSNAGDAEALIAAIEKFLQNQFGWVVSHRMLAEELRSRYEKANRAAGTPSVAGKPAGPAPLPAADEKLIQRIASETRVDAVLETQIEQVMVKLDSYTATWDGARESLGSTGERAAAILTLRPVRGQVPAATAVLTLRDPAGRPLWSQRRGFCVLAQRVGGSFLDRPISEAVEDTARVDAWLNDVFGSWLAQSSNSTAQR